MGVNSGSSGPSPEQTAASRQGLAAMNTELYGDPYDTSGGLEQIDVAEYFPGQNYVGMANQTAQGIQGLTGRAAGTPGQSSIESLGQSFLTGQSPGAQTASAAQGALAPGIAALQQGGQGVGGGAAANAALQGYASGRVNPLTSQMFQQAAQNMDRSFQRNTAPALQDMFANSGGAGSSLAAGAMGQAAGDLNLAKGNLAASMFGGASEAALNRGVSAASSLGGLNEAASQRQLASGQALSGLGMQGGQMADQQALSGTQLAGTADQMQRQNIFDLMQGGATAEAAQGRQIAGDMDRYNYTANMDQMQRERNMQAIGAPTGMLSSLPGVSRSMGFSLK